MMSDDGLEEEPLEEFKGGSLIINPETNRSSTDGLASSKLNGDSPDKNDNEKSIRNNASVSNSGSSNSNNNAQWSANLTTIPHKITETLWNRKPKEDANRNNAIQATAAICVTEDPNNFFTFRESVIARALTECKDQFLDDESDGPLLEAFLLTQISHWNSDKERLILLTPKTLVVVKYDFIALKRLSYKKLPLDAVDEVIVGELVYPTGSLIPNRNMKGIRLIWNKDKPLNLGSQWNPFNEDVPFCTLTYHPLYFHKDCENEKIRSLYNLELFIDRLCMTLADQPRNKNPTTACTIEEKDIILQNYVGLGSVIHNRNSLGFFKVRGKFSF